MGIKEVWKIWRNDLSNKDMKRCFERMVSPQECYKLLEELERKNQLINKLEDDIRHILGEEKEK